MANSDRIAVSSSVTVWNRSTLKYDERFQFHNFSEDSKVLVTAF